jgi:glycosyltransferase involved in cell wall biosynthesis
MVFKMDKIKILRITTVPISLKILTKGQMRFLSENGFEVHCASAEGMEIESLFEYEKINSHTILPLKRTINPFADIKAIYACYKLIKNLKPAIVHTYTPKAGLIGMAAAYFAGTKIRMHNVTGLPLMEASLFKKAILIIVERMVYRFATNVYVNSFGLLEYIKTNISTHNKVKILGNGSTNGIDTEYYKKNEDLEIISEKIKTQNGLEPQHFVWLFIGRLVKDKGINELLIAFENLSKTNTKVKLVLVGPYENDLDPISDKSKEIIATNKSIIVTGFVEDVRPFLVLADCLVFPSYREGLPNVPMQAACFNLPIIATNINGCNEMVNDNVNGILIQPKNSEKLLEAMNIILSNKLLRTNFIQVTRCIIEEKYNQKKVWSNLLNEYKILLNV